MALRDVLHGVVFEPMISAFKCVLGLALTCLSKKVYKIIERDWKLFKITILSTGDRKEITRKTKTLVGG
jgi:hypothetical protein